MLKKGAFLVVCIMMAALLCATCCFANEMVAGVVKSFDAKSGRLVMQTASQREANFSIPQTAKVYLRAKAKDIEITNSWQFLQDNLMKDTKVQLMAAGGTLVTIWILRIPQ